MGAKVVWSEVCGGKNVRIVDTGRDELLFEELGKDSLDEPIWVPWTALADGPRSFSYGQIMNGMGSGVVVNERYYQLKVELLTKALRGVFGVSK